MSKKDVAVFAITYTAGLIAAATVVRVLSPKPLPPIEFTDPMAEVTDMLKAAQQKLIDQVNSPEFIEDCRLIDEAAARMGM